MSSNKSKLNKDNKLKVKVPTHIVRNEKIYLNNGEFLIYSQICYLYFRNYQQEEIMIDYKKLMKELNIKDKRTLKKYLNKLYKYELIRNEIDKFPYSREMLIIFNSNVYDDNQFTMMGSVIFDYINIISEDGFRLLWYYKSHINMSDKTRDRSYCYVGYRTLSKYLKMGNSTLQNSNEILLTNKLIKVKKHKIEDTNELDNNDVLIITKYNNHYYVNNDLF